jgi:hypothetical protein
VDNLTKQLLSRPAFELYYQEKSINSAFAYVDELIDGAYLEGKITKKEKTSLERLNDDIYREFSG